PGKQPGLCSALDQPSQRSCPSICKAPLLQIFEALAIDATLMGSLKPLNLLTLQPFIPSTGD
ncbi:MAG: hypothetical protein AAB070_02115, partial [Candidatus Binatota bacterium]